MRHRQFLAHVRADLVKAAIFRGNHGPGVSYQLPTYRVFVSGDNTAKNPPVVVDRYPPDNIPWAQAALLLGWDGLA